ncbi:MAG: hypothetical protein LQ352_006462 [Teloschistes flavicans]|nr:MAG: hypothetical protein LQ352_006462 [Teloschistes flavicans]
MAENPKLRAWRIKVLAEKNKLSRFEEVPAPIGPSMQEVINVRKVLLDRRLPLEIIDLIMDFAELWPHTTSTTQYQTVVHSEGPSLWVRDWRSLPFSMDHGPVPDSYRIWLRNAFLLRTHPLGLQTREPDAVVKAGVVSRWKQRLKRDRRRKSSSGPTWLPPRGLRSCRKIIFEILSHQEALGFSEAQYGDSPTWFDVSVEKILPEEGEIGPATWTTSMNEEYGDDILGCTSDGPGLQLLKKVPGVGVNQDRSSRQASLASSMMDDGPMQHFETRRTKPTRAATLRQTVVQQNYQGDAYHRQHIITWRYDDTLDMNSFEGENTIMETGTHSNGDFVRKLESGESVILWARARNRPRDSSKSSGVADPCINVVDRVRMHVFWAV